MMARCGFLSRIPHLILEPKQQSPYMTTSAADLVGLIARVAQRNFVQSACRCLCVHFPLVWTPEVPIWPSVHPWLPFQLISGWLGRFRSLNHLLRLAPLRREEISYLELVSFEGPWIPGPLFHGLRSGCDGLGARSTEGVFRPP